VFHTPFLWLSGMRDGYALAIHVFAIALLAVECAVIGLLLPRAGNPPA
jgi:hypothetical protein